MIEKALTLPGAETLSAVTYWDEQFWRMLRGDDKAFEAIFKGYNSKLHRFLSRQVGYRADGPTLEDLLQGVWMRFIDLRKKPPMKKEEPFLVQAFLFRIARNLSIDFLRTRKDHAPIDSIADEDHPVSDFGQNRPDAEEIVDRAFAELSDEYREVLELNLHLGYRLDEIATMLDKTPEAIWKRASRARAKLRKTVVEMARKEKISLKDYTSQKEAVQ
ncbi:MAG TPA: RNA polymerase sigma factor [Candidatus Kapabacteria bacterium]|jgi:RNA polymerase sigma factor (sigma-70 family)